MDIHYGFAFYLERIGLLHMNQASPISINNIILLKVKASKKDPKHVFFRVIDMKRARSFRLPFWARACT